MTGVRCSMRWMRPRHCEYSPPNAKSKRPALVADLIGASSKIGDTILRSEAWILQVRAHITYRRRGKTAGEDGWAHMDQLFGKYKVARRPILHLWPKRFSHKVGDGIKTSTAKKKPWRLLICSRTGHLVRALVTSAASAARRRDRLRVPSTCTSPPRSSCHRGIQCLL
eukprot:scaffold38244_cov30-Tisochrysis_lutea.AAC.4